VPAARRPGAAVVHGVYFGADGAERFRFQAAEFPAVYEVLRARGQDPGCKTNGDTLLFV